MALLSGFSSDYAQRKVNLAYLRVSALWDEYGKTALHYGWVPGVILFGLAYARELSTARILDAVYPL